MITASQLSKNYGKKILFAGLNLSINRGEKIGLIGPNGSGKSTFFSLVLGETEPSSGEIQIHKGVRIGYLPQEAHFNSGRSVMAELTEGDELVLCLKSEKEKLEQENAAHSQRYGEVLHELENLGYFQLEHKAEKNLMGLGFKESDFNRNINQLSGGWQMRVLLAKLLTFQYDILLLDEPTNYLDLNASLWLKDYLREFKGTFLMISHDKAYLNEVTNYTLILENGSIFKVKGNYEHYEQIKQERRTFLIRQFKEVEKKRQQLEIFVSRFHAQPNKAAAVRAKRTALEKLPGITVPPDPRESIRDFHFPETAVSGYRVLRLAAISKSYGDINVYKDFDFEIQQGEKAVLVGENGAGKSTLLKILAGIIPQDSGERIVGHNVSVGYFSQTRMDVLNPENTVLEEAYTAATGTMGQEVIRTILGAFLFTGEDSDKKVKVLSGGEKSRLILAKLLIRPPNFLLLDEPTTHLDVDAVDALIRALVDYRGTIVFISHDIHFVRSVANIVFEVKSGRVRKFSGAFDYYLEKMQKGEIMEQVEHNKQAKSILPKAMDQGKQNESLCKVEERNRKAHNTQVKQEINKLKKEKETLGLEHFAKSRAVKNPRGYRDEESLDEYILRLHEIEQRIAEINDEIRKLKKEVKD